MLFYCQMWSHIYSMIFLAMMALIVGTVVAVLDARYGEPTRFIRQTVDSTSSKN